MKMRHRHNSQCTFFSALSKAVHNINIDFFFQMCVWMSIFADSHGRRIYSKNWNMHHMNTPLHQQLNSLFLRFCYVSVLQFIKKAKYTTLFASNFHILICTLCDCLDMVGFRWILRWHSHSSRDLFIMDDLRTISLKCLWCMISLGSVSSQNHTVKNCPV